MHDFHSSLSQQNQLNCRGVVSLRMLIHRPMHVFPGCFRRNVLVFSNRLPPDAVQHVVGVRPADFGVPPHELVLFVDGMRAYFTAVESDLARSFDLSPAVLRAICTLPPHWIAPPPPPPSTGSAAQSSSASLFTAYAASVDPRSSLAAVRSISDALLGNADDVAAALALARSSSSSLVFLSPVSASSSSSSSPSSAESPPSGSVESIAAERHWLGAAYALPPRWASELGLSAPLTQAQERAVLVLAQMRRHWERMRACLAEYAAHVDAFCTYQYRVAYQQVCVERACMDVTCPRRFHLMW